LWFLFLKIKLEKALLERADAMSCSRSCESSLQLAHDELKRFEEQNEQSKQDIQQFVQSVDEQRSVISEFENRLQDSQTKCTELENEKQRVQDDFDQYYQRTHHLEELQQKSTQVKKTKKQSFIYILFYLSIEWNSP
jgi:chromosome segregation ATPase